MPTARAGGQHDPAPPRVPAAPAAAGAVPDRLGPGARRQTAGQQRPPPRRERGAESDEKPGRGDDPRAASDAELTDEQLDREAPGVEDAAELEAAEDDLAAEAETDEDKVVAARPTGARRGSRITAGDDE
ncbi:MAG TPA: hypothetical protein VER97_01355, partial [Geodermatophilus sp.]|nr:hypothetical protein [Geodermatophilus sp.]